MSDTFTVERSTSIKASAERIHAFLNDFRQWVDWSPWEGIDDNLERTYSGPTSGVGAGYAWAGNRKVGSGSMVVTRSVPPLRLDIDLRFVKPFKAENKTEFHLVREDDGDSTRVVWTMSGKKTLMSKVMGLFMSMDKLVGRDFEKGLAKLKQLAEA